MEYVEWLEAEDEDTGKIFKFESVLKYVNFPDPNAQIPKHGQDRAAVLRAEHNEIGIVFQWLKRRGVQQVLYRAVGA